MQDSLKSILISQLNYSDYEGEITAKDLINLQPQLQQYLKQWLKDRTTPEVVVKKFSTSDLMKKKGFTYPAALIAMDWLLTDPVTAERELSSDIKR